MRTYSVLAILAMVFVPIFGNAAQCGGLLGGKSAAPLLANSNPLDRQWNKRRQPAEPINLILKTRDIYADATVNDDLPDAPKAYAGLTLDDFMTPDGTMVLFRFISQPYQKDYDGPNFSRNAGLSFTISPKVALDHYGEMVRKSAQTSFSMSEPLILIAVQNWERDHLENPWSIAPEGMIYYETRIPKAEMSREDVVGIVRVEDFKRVIQSFDSSSVPLVRFLEKLRPYMLPPK